MGFGKEGKGLGNGLGVFRWPSRSIDVVSGGSLDICQVCVLPQNNDDVPVMSDTKYVVLVSVPEYVFYDLGYRAFPVYCAFPVGVIFLVVHIRKQRINSSQIVSHALARFSHRRNGCGADWMAGARKMANNENLWKWSQTSSQHIWLENGKRRRLKADLCGTHTVKCH